MAHFTLQEAADRLGVHYMTMYRYVRLGLIPATKKGGSWRVAADDLEAFSRPQAGRPEHGEAGEPGRWVDRLVSRMLAGDSAGSWSVVEAAMASGASPEDVYADIIAPAMTAIGDRWEQGELEVEDEHLASAVAGRLIGKLGPRFARRGRSKGVVVATTPPGERHGFGVAMISDIIRGRGFEVLELGPDLPVESLIRALGRIDDLRAVCFSVVSTSNLASCGAAVTAVKEHFPAVAVIVGGRAFADEDQALALGADGFSVEAVGAADLVSALVG
ncbi:MAG: B12-binding domain-containing protein [Acidimicrobiia bacterium]|nr:B12-binding domain-containing protein [Acidimicrobiia bacterium]